MDAILKIIQLIITGGPAVYAQIAELLGPDIPTLDEFVAASQELDTMIAAEQAKT